VACVAALVLSETATAEVGFVTHQTDKTNDPSAMSANDFEKILNKSLGDKFKDLVVVLGACFSGDFITAMKESKAAKSDKNFATLASTGLDCPFAGGSYDQGNSFLQGLASGFSPAFSGTPGTVAQAFDAGKKQVERDKQKAPNPLKNAEPTIYPETDKAKNITFGQGATSYHAILFSGEPQSCADWYDVVKMYDTLVTSNYKPDDIRV
jgi:hypothetical protein